MPEKSFLVINVSMDTKEIKGGREEFILKPPGIFKLETFKHTGQLNVYRRFDLSKKNSYVSAIQTITREKRWDAWGSVTSLGDNIKDGVNSVGENIQDGVNIVQDNIPNPFDFNVLSFLSTTIPTDLSSFQKLLGSIESIGKYLFEESVDKIFEELGKLPVQAEDKYFILSFFSNMDATDLNLWNTKRMTGFTASWHYENENGTKIDIQEEMEEDYKDYNLFFIQWINIVKKAIGSIGKDKLFEEV